jgi:hypothetical protein
MYSSYRYKDVAKVAGGSQVAAPAQAYGRSWLTNGMVVEPKIQ